MYVYTYYTTQKLLIFNISKELWILHKYYHCEIIVHNFMVSSPKSTLSLLFLDTYLSPFLYMKMKEKAIILLFMLWFAFSSSLPSTTAVPSSRSLKSINDENTSNQHLYHEFQKKERMDVETADYSGTGANPHHDPKSPPGSF